MIDLKKAAQDAALIAKMRGQGDALKHLAGEVVEAQAARTCWEVAENGLDDYCLELADCVICALSAFGEIENAPHSIDWYVNEKMRQNAGRVEK